MKTRMITLGLAICATLLMMGADFMVPQEATSNAPRFCSGYVVIEAGKGLDCNGDTILLVTRKGYYERIYIEQPSIEEGVAVN